MTIPFDTTKPNMVRMYDYWLADASWWARHSTSMTRQTAA